MIEQPEQDVVAGRLIPQFAALFRRKRRAL
jgi:hypothetical protein